MARECVYRLRCDRCHTLHELDDPYNGIPKEWGGFTMEDYHANGEDPLWYHLCKPCFKALQDFMNGLEVLPTFKMEPNTYQWVPTENPLEQFGFESMGE